MLGSAGAAELSVLLAPQNRQVGAEQGDDHRRHQQHVQDEESTFERRARELAAEEQEGEPRAEDGNSEHDRVGDAQARAREEVVGQGVAGEAVGDGEEQQRHPDNPIQLSRPPEGAGEEDAA